MADKAHILVVDDNEMNRDMLSRRLKRKGFAVTVAEGGEEAIETLAHIDDFHVVLLDLHMPKVNGLEVLNAIRELRSQLELPVLMVTADTDNQAVVEALGRGANDYVTKPINLPVVLARIESALTLSRAYASQIDKARKASTTAERKRPRIDNRYELEALIGEGGFAVVYKARQVSTGQTVAIKLLRSHRAHGQNAVEFARFDREMQLIGRIKHPNIVSLIDSGHMRLSDGSNMLAEPTSLDSQLLPDTVIVRSDTAEQDTGDLTPLPPSVRENEPSIPYIVMEYLEGETLNDRLTRETQLDIREAIAILLPVMSAVHCAHEHGVIHRDLKPANIFLCRMHDDSISVRVLDFGIAKMISEEEPDKLTVTMSVIGTPNYMSPEQARSQRHLTPASDQYTLGVLLYECVCGDRPYTSEGFLPLIQEVAAGGFLPPRSRNPKIPLELERIILRAMAPEPEERYTSVAALAEDLEAFLNAEWSVSSSTADVEALVLDAEE